MARGGWYNPKLTAEPLDTEVYRSGHNGPDSKSGSPQGLVGSNPTASANEKSSHIKAFALYDWFFLFAAIEAHDFRQEIMFAIRWPLFPAEAGHCPYCASFIYALFLDFLRVYDSPALHQSPMCNNRICSLDNGTCLICTGY